MIGRIIDLIGVSVRDPGAAIAALKGLGVGRRESWLTIFLAASVGAIMSWLLMRTLPGAEAGMDRLASQPMGMALLQVGAAALFAALVDRVGRKPLLLIGSAGMAVTLSTMAIVFSSATVLDGKPHLGPVAGPVALVAANLFVVAFGMSWGPVVWVLLGEIFPNRIRAAAMGVATAGNWAANWLVTVSFPALRDSLGIAYGFYAICAVVSLVFVARWVNETKGRTLEDMESAIN